MLYESLLLLGVLAAGFMLPHLILGIAWGLSAPGLLLVVHVYGVLGAYFLWLWRKDGQTLAMQTWRIRLVDARSGKIVSLSRGLLRYTLAWPSLLIYGVGLIWALFDRDRQFLHDRLAGTRLVLLAPAGRK
jgi:uncharacterized RDD family membrane protein YckC